MSKMLVKFSFTTVHFSFESLLRDAESVVFSTLQLWAALCVDPHALSVHWYAPWHYRLQ